MSLLGTGLDLLFYIDNGTGTHVYRLLLDGELFDDVILRVSEPDHRVILDGVRAEWALAQNADHNKNVLATFAFTWRGLRLLFPQLPEEPMVQRNQG